MKKILLSFLLFSSWLLTTPDSSGQTSPIPPDGTFFVLPQAGDTLPAITMKFEYLVLVPYFLAPGAALFLGGHSYRINERKHYLSSAAKPYFDATQSELVVDLYGKHRRNRTIWYSATALAQVVATVGFVQRTKVFYFIPYYDSRNNNYLLWAGGLMLGGLAARIVCFRNMRKAVDLYNYQSLSRKPAISLHIGLPSSTPAGLGLYVKF